VPPETLAAAVPRIRPVDPIPFADSASALLRAAWKPPCIDYTPDYVRFQCGFPTPLPPIGIAAFDGEDPVGFVAATGRASNAGPIYLASYLALRPGTIPSLSVAIVRAESRKLLEAKAPMLVFAQVGSVGEYLLKIFESMGLARTFIGEYRVHAGTPKEIPAGLHVEDVPPEAWAREAAVLEPDGLLSPTFDNANLAHFARDPFGRRFVVVRRGDGVVATGMQSWTQIVPSSGPGRVPALNYVRLKGDDPDALVALLALPRHEHSPVVTLPNTAGARHDVAKAAGLRATGSVFAAYVFHIGGEFPTFRGTEFEII